MQLIKEKKQIKKSTVRLGRHLSLQSAVVTACTIWLNNNFCIFSTQHNYVFCNVLRIKSDKLATQCRQTILCETQLGLSIM